MFAKILLVFIVVPLVDLFLLIVISKYVTVFTTIGLVVVSGIIGAWLAKQQGLAVGNRIRQQMSQNKMPGDLFTDGAMILFAAGLLITPGLLTDLAGFSLLIPFCRNWYKKTVVKYIKSHFKVQVVHSDQAFQDPSVVEGEVVNDRTEDV